MKICEIKTKTNEVYTMYDVAEVSENEEWVAVRTKDGYKRSVKKEFIDKKRIYED